MSYFLYTYFFYLAYECLRIYKKFKCKNFNIKKQINKSKIHIVIFKKTDIHLNFTYLCRKNFNLYKKIPFDG